MNTVVVARDFPLPVSRQPHPRQRLAAARARAAVLPWADVPVANSTCRVKHKASGGLRVYAWIMVGFVVLLHLSLTWYASRRVAAPAAPHKTELTVQLAAPPPPEVKRIEPPRPIKATPKVQRPASTVPTISQPTETPRDEPADIPSVAVPPPAPAAPPAEAAPAPVTAPFGKAGYLNNPPPGYPPLAARNHWEGKVLLHVRVLSTGLVESIDVQKSSGRSVLDDEAVRAVKHWLFAPAKRGDTPVDGWATVPIEFLL